MHFRLTPRSMTLDNLDRTTTSKQAKLVTIMLERLTQIPGHLWNLTAVSTWKLMKICPLVNCVQLHSTTEWGSASAVFQPNFIGRLASRTRPYNLEVRSRCRIFSGYPPESPCQFLDLVHSLMSLCALY